MRADWKTCSMSGGISPAKSLAVKRAWPTKVRASFAHSFADCLLTQGEQFLELLVGQLGQPVLARADNFLGDGLLPLDHFVDLLLQRADADEFVDLDVAILADAERAVGRLILDGRVPPAVE